MAKESRMAKILKRLSGNDEAEVDTSKKEKIMAEKTSKYEKPTRKELNVDLSDIAGETTPAKKNIVVDLPAVMEITKPDLYENKARTTYGNKQAPSFEDKIENTWICFFEDGALQHRELRTCTGEDFAKWLTWVYPPGKEFLAKNPRHFDKYDNRKTEFSNLVGFFTRLPKLLKAYGESSFLPLNDDKKTDKKVGGKNE